MRTALENAVVALFKEYYGRGPSAAKAWILDDYVVVVLEVKAVADVVGREVIGYHSQIIFNPTRSFELFVLAPDLSSGAATAD